MIIQRLSIKYFLHYLMEIITLLNIFEYMAFEESV